jgi:hypothetical protein
LASLPTASLAPTRTASSSSRWSLRPCESLPSVTTSPTPSNLCTEALTETGTSENCYAVPGHQKFCNVGDLIRINLPTASGTVDHRNYLHIQLYGDTVTGEFKCCPTRYKVDQGLDKFGQDVQNGFQTPWSKDTRCLIWGSYICESCGSKCDSCGSRCPDVCPKGKCEG